MDDPHFDQESDGRIDSDADSDLEDLQHDIEKLNNSVREFLASQRQERPHDIPDDYERPSQEPAKPSRGGGARRGLRGPRKAAKPRGDITARLAKVNQAFLLGDYSRALDLAFEVIRINAETHQAWTTVASIFREQGELNRALSAMVYAAHLRPRDVPGWLRCADFALENIQDDEAGNLHTARLCYSAAIKADPSRVDARLGKAAICERQGHLATAASEYRLVLKRQPNHLDTIRKLAEVCIENKSVETAVPFAMEAYRRYFDMQSGEHNEEDLQERWHDVGIYIELFVSTGMWRDAIRELKRLCRWLLDRANESYWDSWQVDDREWDLDDERRSQVPEYMAGANIETTYALPLDYRVRLAIYRLHLGDFPEAEHHMTWIKPDLPQTTEFVVDYPFLVYDIAVELSRNHQNPQAIQYLLLLRAIPGDPDAALLLILGQCYLSVGDNAAAEECFLSAIEADADNIEARVQLAGMYERAREDEDALVMAAEAMALRDAQESRSRPWQGQAGSALRPLAPLRPKGTSLVNSYNRGAGALPKRAAMPRRYKPKRFAGLEERLQDEQIRATEFSRQYDQVRELRRQIKDGDTSLMDTWLDASRDMIDDFRSVKKNYSWDKYLEYLAPKAATETGLENEEEQNELSQLYQRLTKALAPRMESHEGVSHSALLKVHQGISYDDWLQLFLDYAVGLALLHRKDESYRICESARDSSAFQSNEHNFLIHVTWGVCGILNRDEEVCVKTARHLVKERVLSDSCRMLALITTLCQSPVSWYTSGPSQKFLLRQVKMMDARNGVELAGQDGLLIRAEPTEDARLDVCILMLYGHVLFTSTSYLNALSYFIRARSIDPDNAMVNLSLGLAYTHSAMKRQAVNRQYLLLQGQVFMSRYMEVDAMAGGRNRMEVLFNLGRLYQLLGVNHVALEYYEQALGEDRGDQTSADIRCLIYANQVISALLVSNKGRALQLMKEGARL